MKILQLKNINRVFKNKKETINSLDNITFDVSSSEIVAILGPNGAGKTTLVKIVSGYLYPSSGDVVFNNQNEKNIGVVFGGELGFYNNATIYDNLVFFANLKKIKNKQIKQEINRVLSIVKLEDVENRKVEALSTGMKQRLHIARALIGNPKILLFDEPTAGLDIEIVHEIRKVILELKQKGHAIILTSHLMGDIENLADKIIILNKGHKIYDGTIENFIKERGLEALETNLEDAYLQYIKKVKGVLNESS